MRVLLTLMVSAVLAAPVHAATIACDARIKRIADNLRRETMTPDEAERARQALYDAIDKCRPLSSGSPSPRSSSATRPETPPDTQRERQSLRAQQNVLTPSEQREAERRLDAIDQRAKTEPRSAQDRLRIYDADRSLSTINRPFPGGGPTGLNPVVPGEQN